MLNALSNGNQIVFVSTFQKLVTFSFKGARNAICWSRELKGNFSEIIEKLASSENITLIEPADLMALQLSEAGELARQVLIEDFNLLQAHGASPSLNIIKYYERDASAHFFPTDVYSFHVDRAPIPSDTFLCTYHGNASEILPNAQAEQKILVPEIRAQLKKQFEGKEHDFDNYLEEHFYDLHYQAKTNARPINLGLYNMWRMATDYPNSPALPCIHRAPEEKSGEARLLLIC